MTARKPLRLVHTSDVHLGMEDRHDLATGAFGRVVDGVQALDADMLLVVGDLFDNARVSDELVEYFVDQVRRLDVPVVVLPGNHDLYDSTSVYHRDPFADIPGNLHVFTDHEGEVLDFPALGLSLWGRAMRTHPRLPAPAGHPTPVQRKLVRCPRPWPPLLPWRGRPPSLPHISRGDRGRWLRLRGPGPLGPPSGCIPGKGACPLLGWPHAIVVGGQAGLRRAGGVGPGGRSPGAPMAPGQGGVALTPGLFPHQRLDPRRSP